MSNQKALSIDLETTGLTDDSIILEFAAVPVEIKEDCSYELSEDVFHFYFKSPTMPMLVKHYGVDKFIQDNHAELVEKCNKEGKCSLEFLREFGKYMERVKDTFFNGEKPVLLGKSLSALDLPLLTRDFGRDEFIRKHFAHRNIEVSSLALALSNAGVLSKAETGSTGLAKRFLSKKDVDHTALGDAKDMPEIYSNLLKLIK